MAREFLQKDKMAIMSQGIRYYSTNRQLDHIPGIVPFKAGVSFGEALLQGQAPDEGLFMPERIPSLTIRDILALKGMPYTSAAMLVAKAFLGADLPENILEAIVSDSYNYPVPFEKVVDRKYILRLDQGPTASFKDFAARMMARLMSHYRNPGKRLNVLVATSGDTGSAVGEAFKGVDGIDVYILYPRSEVSGRQKKQLDTIGQNVQALSVDGKFDDCQNLVKQAFSDPSFAAFNLTSANSINFGRILPQIVYYIYAYAQLASDGEEIVFSVPSGNFGDALGCEYARRMGLPVKKLVMPTNENDEFPRFLETGSYRKVSPSRACISNAMNVGHPSNLARLRVSFVS
jgi:threonine synthase